MPALPHEGQLLRRGAALTTQLPPPGWYADPWSGHTDELRWWDGWQWTSHTSTPPRQPGQPGRPAGWWQRALAYVVDSIVVGIASSIVTFPAQRDFRAAIQQQQEDLTRQVDEGTAPPVLDAFWSGMADAWAEHWFWLSVVPALIAVAYHVVMLRLRGATVGKMALHLEVVPVDEEARLPLWSIAVRVLVVFGVGAVVFPVVLLGQSLTLAVVVLGAAFVWQVLDPLWAAGTSRRALHDLVARTRVIRR